MTEHKSILFSTIYCPTPAFPKGSLRSSTSRYLRRVRIPAGSAPITDAAVRFFEDQVDKENLDRLRALYKALLESMSVVQIDVWDPINGPKIFDSLKTRANDNRRFDPE